MTAACILMFLFSAAALYYVVRYRIHIHVTYQTPTRQPRRRPAGSPKRPAARSSEQDAEVSALARTLTETLVGQGATQTKARAASVAAILALGKDAAIDQLIRAAVQFHQKAA